MSSLDLEERASFTALRDATADDLRIVLANAKEFTAGLADRVVAHLRLLDGDFGGFPVHRLEHSLQTATRAHQAGMDEEYVVCALLHDIGDTLGAHNHAEVAAAILRPFVSERHHWMVLNHTPFQGYYYFHHIGQDRNARERHRGHPHFAYTAEFCERFDQAAFDPAFTSMPLAAFTPMVHRVFSAPKYSLYMAG